ncbi:hypothetical protein CCHL11_05549 [Colletotrichum chlorophyti]|uniref:Glycine-rich cell wall structural protein 1 n=1 Tax=Colletotrichum chlorophyti TaxID=708187 RepID=A0A1Q8RBJ9_9PEZI|nr:hypothetical protein CCHL11_05549 [Colletotrichum chlorophyti]
METINNLTTAASKAIWGTNETKEEPVSGVTGNTNQGEPYDAGNIEDPQKKANVADSHTQPSGLTTGPTIPSTSDSTTTSATAPTTTAITDRTKEPTSESVTTPATAPTTSSATEDSHKHKEEIGKPELKHESPTDAPHADSAAGKSDIRDPSDPATDAAPKGQDVTNSAGGPTTQGDKLDGPGPRPLETVAKERGGDAGNVSNSSSGSSDKEDDGPQKVSHGEGTGEKYVKSSGLAAEGGDFDATKPGAGREADRLLEERDPAHAAAKAESKSHSHDSKLSDKSGEEHSHSPGAGGDKEKKSLGDKIKAKLHRH